MSEKTTKTQTQGDVRTETLYDPRKKEKRVFHLLPYVDFGKDPVIPVVIGMVTCNYDIRLFNGKILEKGPSVLLLRRGFEVSALTGLWSVVAGVDDIRPDDSINQAEARVVRMYSEVLDETGITPDQIVDVRRVRNFDNPNPGNPGQVFRQTVFQIITRPIETIRLCFEHTGAVFVSISDIRRHIKNPLRDVENRVLQAVINDGMTPDLLGNLACIQDF